MTFIKNFAEAAGYTAGVAIPATLMSQYLQHTARQSHEKMMTRLNARQLEGQQKMMSQLFNTFFKKGLYALLGAVGLGGFSVVGNSLSKGYAAKMTENAARKTALAKTKAEGKLAVKKAEAEANLLKVKADQEIRAEEGKVDARVKETGKTIAERVKGSIEPIEMKREHSLDDIHGQNDAIEEARAILLRIVNFERLKSFKIGGSERTFKPILMTGPPGTGKTETVRAITSMARKDNVNLSSYIVNINKIPPDLAGHTMDAMKTLAKENTQKGIKTLFFMDEMDSIQGKTEIGNEILTLMDGMNPLPDDVIILGATNKPENLPQALLSRFEQIPFASATPDIRKTIFKSGFQHWKVVPQADVDMDKIAALTEGFNGRDINKVVENIRKDLVNQALKNPSESQQNELRVSQAQLEAAVRKMRFKVDLIDADSFKMENVLKRKSEENAFRQNKKQRVG
jgi:AAA+ superfamily predicted ATPase